MSNNTSIIYPLESPEATVRFVVYIGSLVLGTVGGCAVLAAIFNKRENKTDNDIFLTNLAVSDMLTIWIYVGVRFYINSGHLKGKHFCRYVWPLMSVPLFTSILNITSMAIIRCRSVLFMWTQTITNKTAKIWVLGLWLVAFGALIPALVVSKSAGRYCFLNWTTINQRRAYTLFLFAVQYFIPLSLVLCSYIGICFNLKKYERQVERENVRNENRDIIKALVLIGLVFAIFLMPLQVGMMMWDFGEIETKLFVRSFMNYADILCIFHSCLNPFIYGMVPREFRKRYSKWIALAISRISRIADNCYRPLNYKLRRQRTVDGNDTYLETATNDVLHITTL